MEGDKKSTGTVYNFCESCDACPVSEEALIENNSGLILRDDFGGDFSRDRQVLRKLH